jgi:CarboxypepD_reg-like domain/TonB-dependent Receptor Plug Domain
MRKATFVFLVFLSISGFSQKKIAFISGKVIDENENPIKGASITVLGNQNGFVSSDSGTFHLTVPSGRAFALIFSATGYKDEQRNFFLNENESEHIVVKLYSTSKLLAPVVVQNQKERMETGLVKINPKDVSALPSVTGGVEGLIKTLVGSNNELTSQYSVRGGNFDENLIYINDFEIYRPFLVSNAQQEGLSFINPDLVKNIDFYTGGFPASYGDKISSVLDIQYRQPKSFNGSVYLSLLEQGLHLEGLSKNQKFSWLLGVRSKTNKSVLSSQEVQGNYIPSAADLQGLFTYKISKKLQLGLLGIVSGSKFTFIPQSAQKTTAVFSPLFTADLALDIFFNGQEIDNYNTNLVGLSLDHFINKRLKLKWMVSHYGDIENENYDITGDYLFGERDFDKTSATYGQIVNPLGAGVYQDYARNSLNIDVYNFSHKGSLSEGKHYIQWGASVDHTIIHDKLNQWEYQDSAEYSLPYNPNVLNLNNVIKSDANLLVNKYSGFLQDNMRLGDSLRHLALQAGIRFNYNSLNGEFIVSPRAEISYRPNWNKDVIFKASAGIYDQPPFYREMRRYDGTVNTALKSQKSKQFVAGFDYNLSNTIRPMRITTEAYYKWLTDVDVYDINNVNIQYYGNNNAVAYAAGIETRLYTELIKDAESWLSIGVAQTKEKIDNDYYYIYTNAEGQQITAQTTDQVVADSTRKEVGFVRRPTDRRLTIGLFLQDYLSTNKNFKVHLNLIYGSNMPYNIPNSVRYRDALIIEPYMRVDLGFSALLLSEKSARRSHSPFRAFNNIWASLEIFNVIDRANVISYQFVKDFANDTFVIPNRLTPRLINFKILARF